MLETHSFAKNSAAKSSPSPARMPRSKCATDELPSDLVDRIRRGLDARGYFVFGNDDLQAVWRDNSAHPGREKLLRDLAATFGAELQQGWTRNVALFQRGNPSA